MSDFSEHFYKLRASITQGNIDELEKYFSTYLSEFPHMVDFQDSDGRTLLIYALLSGKKNVVNYLMYEQGADVDTVDKFNKDALEYEREWNKKNPNNKINYVEQEIAERSSMSEGSIPRSSMSSLTDKNIYPRSRSRSRSMSEDSVTSYHSTISTLSDTSTGGSKKRKTTVKTQKRKRYNKKKTMKSKRRSNKRRKMVGYY